MNNQEGRAAASPIELLPWESSVVEAVGNAIEFWGFKANQGRVWALLYLRGAAMTALELQKALGLSKGAASMVTRELEQWGVVHRIRSAGASAWKFQAETDLMRMIGRVLEQREARFIERVSAELAEAERQARTSKASSRESLERLARMRTLANTMSHAVQAFVRTARFDLKGLGGVLQGGATRTLRRWTT